MDGPTERGTVDRGQAWQSRPRETLALPYLEHREPGLESCTTRWLIWLASLVAQLARPHGGG